VNRACKPIALRATKVDPPPRIPYSMQASGYTGTKNSISVDRQAGYEFA